MIFKKDVLKDFAIFTGKSVLESLFNNVVGLKVCNFIIKRLHHKCFPVVNIAKFLRTAFIEHLWWLLLKMSYWTPPQGFLFKWMFMNFSNFLLWEVYPSMVRDGQYIFISTYLSLSWQGQNLQQLKLKHEILNMKSLLNVNLYTWRAFISHVTCLGKTSNSSYKYSRPFLMPKIMWCKDRIPNVFKIQSFPSENIFSPILL